MAIQGIDTMSNGTNIGFDNDADFIPFDLSDDDFDKSRPESRSSIQEIELFSAPISNNGSADRDSQKRKRKNIESSPERGPPLQRQKMSNVDVNPWQIDIDDYASLQETARVLHKEVQDFTNWISPTSKEVEVRAFVVKRVTDAIESAFPQCRAYAFGSFSTKLYHPDADIDLMVDWPGHTWGRESMRQLGRHIERSGIGRSFQYIFGAKVPIIKFVDTYARIDIDLAFNQTNALQVVTLVKNYLQEMPAAQPLVMVLKTLFHQNNLSIPAEGGLGSYSIICMVISFLQRHPKIAAGHIRAEDNLGAMLLEILELYGTRFNFDKVGIAIDHGGSYFHKQDYEFSDPKIWKKICIRDPNDPLNNISKASFQTENIIKVFNDAYKILTTRCYLVYAEIQKGRRAPWGTMCGSLLDSIIERPSVVVRERLQRAWKPSMEEGFEVNGAVSEDIVPIPRPKEGKASRASRRAAQKQAREEAKKKEKEGKKKHSEVQERNKDMESKSPPPPKSPKKKGKAASDKPPPPPNDSLGTKDTPIVLNSPISSPRPAPSRAPQASPSKKKRKSASARAGDVAAANLTASGSISGFPRDIVTID